MEPNSSDRESEISSNASLDNSYLNASIVRNSYEFRNYQSLTSVLNSPDSGFISSVSDFFSFSDSEPTPMMMIPHIEESDFKSFLSKIYDQLQEYLNKRKPHLSDLIDECTTERCFNVVPGVFFEEVFELRRVIEDLAIHDNLSYYLDFTDVCLFRQILGYWEVFLQATDSLQRLEVDVVASLKTVRELRTAFVSIKRSFLDNSLKIVKLQHKQTNTGRVLELLKLIAAIKETTPAVQQLLSAGDFSSALGLIDKSRQILSTKLKGLAGTKNSSKELEGVQQMIERMIKASLITAAVDLISGSVMSQKERLINIIKKSAESNGAMKFSLDTQKFDESVQLIQPKGVKVTLKEISQQTAAGIKEGLKSIANQLGVIKVDPQLSKWSVLSQAHIELVLKVYTSVFSETLSRTDYVIEAFTRKIENESFHFNEPFSEFRKTLLNPFAQVLSRILASRREIYCNGGLEEIREVDRLYKLFLDNNAKDFCLTIRSVLIQVEKEYLDNFHSKKSKEISALLELELWSMVEIPDEMLQMIEGRRVEIANRAGVATKPPQFAAVAATLMMYRILWEYVKVIDELEVPGEANSRMLESVRFFNSRCCQLVLGAGATAIGKVKTITSKMLGLSAQSLNFIITELRFIQLKVAWRLGDLQQTIEADYDRIRNDLTNHERLIHEKLASLLNERIPKHCNSAKSLQWESMLSPEQLGKDYYSVQLTSDLTQLHTALAGILNSTQLREVFTLVFGQLQQSLRDLYSSIPINSSTSAQRVVNDVQLLLLTCKEKVSSSLQDQVTELENSLEAVLATRCRPLL